MKLDRAIRRRETGSSGRWLWVALLVGGLGASCRSARGPVPTPEGRPPDLARAESSSARERLGGRLVVAWGDPPPDSGLPARVSCALTDPQGRRWTLVFDASVPVPPGGFLALNGKEVEVEGRRVGESRLLVESMRVR